MTQDSMVTIEVNGQELKAKAGAMLIEVTDAAGISIPRFCYHRKLSIAANCRMCLVEVANAPKPLPACATPVSNGMKVFTRSPTALAAQKGTMEFLLINHPLDCPICDQGGECELQDVAMGYGRDVSRYVEGKRVVQDKNIGPLIATDMTRCIHCTRCVRFGEEIAGVRELGATGRGEHTVIGTYIEKSVDSELSGNVIDLCPVGALTAKPSRFNARAWELRQHDGIAPHDSLGANIHLHVRGNQVMRVHPRTNEAINENWISDRDRFSYEGLYSKDRLTQPMIKKNGDWHPASWEQALDMAAVSLKAIRDPESLGVLCSPSASMETLYLAQKLARGLGCNNIDHRLRQGDFRLDQAGPTLPWLGMAIEELEQLDAALVIGSNLRKENPLLAHRLRKAALNGAAITFINPLQIDLNYTADQLTCHPAAMLDQLAVLAKALGLKGKGSAANLLKGVKATEESKLLAKALKDAKAGAVLLGNLASAHPDYALIAMLAAQIAEATGAKLGFVLEAANSLGALMAGAVPHLLAGAQANEQAGLNALQMLKQPRKGYLLIGVEPDADFWNPALAQQALRAADNVVALTAYRSEALDACADVMLPIAAFAEGCSTYVNAAGTWQLARGVIKPLGEARPAWKILRVLGNLLALKGFDYVSVAEVGDEVKALCTDVSPENKVGDVADADRYCLSEGLMRIGDVPLYAQDALVRRAKSLQQTKDAGGAVIRLNAKEINRNGWEGLDSALVKQNGSQANLPLELDDRVPDGCVWISAGVPGSGVLGQQYGEVTLEKV